MYGKANEAGLILRGTEVVVKRHDQVLLHEVERVDQDVASQGVTPGRIERIGIIA